MIWIGFLLVLAGGFLFLPLSDPLPGLADWISLAAMLAGTALIGAGLVRAWRRPALHRGKYAAPLLMLVSLGMTAFFWYGVIHQGRMIPDAAGAPRAGSAAPPFTLLDADRHSVSLEDLLDGRGVLLIFYRGHW
jgi:hypothetical protein